MPQRKSQKIFVKQKWESNSMSINIISFLLGVVVGVCIATVIYVLGDPVKKKKK